MAFYPERRRRRSTRLRDYNYGAPGAYFVTSVTANRDSWLTDARLRPIAERRWLAIPRDFAHATLDAWVAMPNHLHGIVVRDTDRASGSGLAGSLGAIIGTFKSVTARQVNRVRRTPGAPVWQRNYYERVIRNGTELERIRGHIAANPLRWALDRENPERLVADHDEWAAGEDHWFTSSSSSDS